MDDNVKAHGWEVRFLLSGTGGKDDGYWHGACQPENGWKVSHATQWDNPYAGNPDKTFRKTCQDAQPKIEVIELSEPIPSPYSDGQPRHVTTDDKETKREWFAEFNSGGRLQIFQHIELIDRRLVPDSWDCLIVGADFGTVDKCAGVAWAFQRHFPQPVLLRYKEEVGLSNSRMVRFHRQFGEECEREYRPKNGVQLIADGGGLGKGNVMDIQETEQAWDVRATQKGVYSVAVKLRVLSGDLKDGAALVCDDLKGWIKSAKGMEWHPDHHGERVRGHTPDKIDAAKDSYYEVKKQHTYEKPPEKMSEIDRELLLEKQIREKMKPRQMY
jgi:hypothetical protein